MKMMVAYFTAMLVPVYQLYVVIPQQTGHLML